MLRNPPNASSQPDEKNEKSIEAEKKTTGREIARTAPRRLQDTAAAVAAGPGSNSICRMRKLFSSRN